MRIRYLIFGTLAILLGIGIAIWLAYNFFVQRLPEFQSPSNPISYVFPFVMIGVGVGMLRKGIRGLGA
jgi:hypothetical protein